MKVSLTAGAGRPASADDALAAAGSAFGRHLSHELGTPARRAFWVGWLAGFALMSRRTRPNVAGIILCTAAASIGGNLAMRVWQASEDLRTIAAASSPSPAAENGDSDDGIPSVP